LIVVGIEKKNSKQSLLKQRKGIMSWYGFKLGLPLQQRRQTYTIDLSLASDYAILFLRICTIAGLRKKAENHRNVTSVRIFVHSLLRRTLRRSEQH